MATDTNGPYYDRLKLRLKSRLVGILSNRPDGGRFGMPRKELEDCVRQAYFSLTDEGRSSKLSDDDEGRMFREVIDEVTGLGPIDQLMIDPSVSEVMVNGPDQVYVERNGVLERAEMKFRDVDHLRAVIERLLGGTGLSVTESEPCVDGSLPDGGRINVIIPPLVLNGPTITIRKELRRFEMNEFVSLGTLSPQAAEFLEKCVKCKANLIISGGTSTGKTTLVSLLSVFIPAQERVITIENVAELELLGREHWIRLIAKSPNLEGRGEIPLRTLVRNALRMRPDRIILGEARAGEALDVVQAMHTGHDGVITVLHANSPGASLERLQTLMLMSGLELPAQACQAQIASAVDMIVHMSRYADGSRRIGTISQVLGVSSAGFEMEELFQFEVRGFRSDGVIEGDLHYTGARPKFLQKFHLNNVPVPEWINTSQQPRVAATA